MISKVTVLVVEDEFLIADDYCATIEAQGWEVMGPAPTAQMGLQLLQERKPSVAVLDLQLQQELSSPVAEALRIQGVPFILASGCRNPVEVGGAAFLGITILSKPVTPRGLVSSLNGAMGRA
jgi:two-component system, response regulator PdtaR